MLTPCSDVVGLRGLRTWCCGQYLGLKRRMFHEVAENYIMRIFIICTLHQAYGKSARIRQVEHGEFM
jgi:hypothetical protein